MTYQFVQRSGNVHLIDSHMFGFDRFQACYLIKGPHITLIDTGVPTSLPHIRRALDQLEVAVGDISHIFVTHGEHPDHSGNVGALLQENTRAKVYIHPQGLTYLTQPEIEANIRKSILPPEMSARFGEMVPVPENRIHLLNDNEVLDIGGGQSLKAIFTPGHQPSGMVLYNEFNGDLFINDLVGLHLPDADTCFIFTPNRAEVKKYITSLEMLKKLPVKTLYLGHFGIRTDPETVIDKALRLMQGMMDIGAECMKAGKPEDIAPRLRAFFHPQIEKLKPVRGETLYTYLKNELVASCAEAFSKYYQELR